MSAACRWCGEHHAQDRLCQRGVAGLTRRSFCFLAAGGLAGASLPGWVAAGHPSPYQVPIDRFIRVTEELLADATMTWRLADASLRPGHQVVLEYAGVKLFTGTVDRVERRPDGLFAHATAPASAIRLEGRP